jgi:hypothetical protein
MKSHNDYYPTFITMISSKIIPAGITDDLPHISEKSSKKNHWIYYTLVEK